MFFHLLYIHLFRPFLKYKQASSPLPVHVSPRKFLIQAATSISKLLRLYRRTYGLRQICNIVVYITHSACTVHLLNLPDKFAGRDVVHGLNHLEEISESWLCARRALDILYQVSRRWDLELPDAALKTFERAEAKFGVKEHDRSVTPKSASSVAVPPAPPIQAPSPSQAEATSSAQFLASVVPDSNYLPYPMPSTGSTTSTELPHVTGSVDLIPQKAAAPNGYYGQQQSYHMPQAQLPHQQQHRAWNGNHTTQAAASDPGMTSPTMLLGGADGLIKDQEWWLQDSNQIFASWNGYDTHDHNAMASSGRSNDIPASIVAGMGTGVTDNMTNTMGNGMSNESMSSGIYEYNQDVGHTDGNTNGIMYRREG